MGQPMPTENWTAADVLVRRDAERMSSAIRAGRSSTCDPVPEWKPLGEGRYPREEIKRGRSGSLFGICEGTGAHEEVLRVR